MIGTRSHFRNGALGAGFKFAVLEDGEGNPTVGEVGEIHADVALDGGGIDRVGEVPGLLTLDHVDVCGWVEIATAGTSGIGGENAFFTPEVGLSDVVVVGDGDGGAVAHDVAELQAELEPAIGVLGVVVSLVAGEEENVRILLDEVFENDRTWSGGAGGITRKVADGDGVLIFGVLADESFEGCFCRVAETVGSVLGGVPILNAEVGGPSGVDDFFFGDFFPGVAVFDFKTDFLGFVRLQWEKLGG